MKDYIKLSNVEKIKKYGKTKYNILDGISFSVSKGEFVVIIGQKEKTTLLNLISGMEKVTNGEIKINEEIISDFSENKLSKYRAENISIINENYNLISSLSVYENVEIVKDVNKKIKNIRSALKEVGLNKYINKFPCELSMDETKKLALARAIVKNPKIILVDEPIASLNSKASIEILKILKKQCEKGSTVIVATQNTLISEIADRVIKLKNSKVESNKINKKQKDIEEVSW